MPNSLEDCANTDNGAKDGYSQGCDDYTSAPSLCGRHDSSYFMSLRMCCVCREQVSGNIHHIFYYISLHFK